MEFIKAKKKFGQNFLKNKEVLQNIANSISVQPNDLIIEIGPGMGALTDYLFQKNCFLMCYEIDERMKPYLEKYNTNHSEIIYGDFLKSDLLEDIKKFNYQNLYVVANIPYYITSPILAKLIDLDIFQNIVLLVQKEFGERIVASAHHKEYNALTLYVDVSYDAKILFPVSKNNFMPVPKVDSVVAKLSKKENIIIKDREFYLQFIRDAFSNKRKTLKNNLRGYDWEKISNILDSFGYSNLVRAEEIDSADFQMLVNRYLEK